MEESSPAAVQFPAPAFGQADLSNCEREQIHLAGSIQPRGALLVAHGPEFKIVQASANASDYLGVEGSVIGRPLAEVSDDLAARIQPFLTRGLDEIPVATRARLGMPLADFDCLLHRPPGAGLVLELERASPPVDLSQDIADALSAIRGAASLRDLFDETARIFKQIAGYSRTMVYRFDEDGHGEVVSERRDAHLESYLGQRYPASDIPQIARRLYQRNRVRVLADVEDIRIPLIPEHSPITGGELDMSLCLLRAMSPIHIQYLQNMGVRATLVASLMVGGRLWGLVACHHDESRSVQHEIRVACELLAESVATRIAALESFAQAQAELSARRIEQRMAEVIAREGDWRTALFEDSRLLLQPLNAAGAALVFEGEVMSVGNVPGTQQLREIGAWLATREDAALHSTASLGIDEPAFEGISNVASGLVATALSNSAGEYLMWFRPAQIHTVTWGGNPFKPFAIGNDTADLSPRRSFAQWHQKVQGTSAPWLAADLAAAKLVGEIVADVILQFRSVRVLIAEDQLSTVREQVQVSEHPVIVADPKGRIILTNGACERLLRAANPHLDQIADLPMLFAETAEMTSLLADLVDRQRSFRTEVGLRSDSNDNQYLAVRGDPVMASPQKILGFVILVTDLGARRAAEAARQRFQEALETQHRTDASVAGSALVYQDLLSSVLGNAQLAALEITDGVDPTRMPKMLDSVRASVRRTAELLEHLATHADPDSRRDS